MSRSGSSSDVEALGRSFRSRVLALAVVCVAAIALATWSATRKVGRGAAEDPQRVMVVTLDKRVAPDYHLLERAGFVVEVDGLAAWEARAHEWLDDSDLTGLELVLEFADLSGVGFVVLEGPAQFEFGELELEPSPDELDDFANAEFAALSVGDLAFPHQLTIDDPGEPAMLRVRNHGAVQAIYRQPRLAEDREELVTRPTIDELKLEDGIRRGRAFVDAPDGFPQVVERVLATQTEALAADGDVRTLVEPLHTGSPLPMAGGGALVLHHELVVYSDDVETLEIDSSDRLTLDWFDAAALASGQLEARVRCTDLLGGEVLLQGHPSFEASSDGRVLAITTERDGARAWRKLDQPGCRFEVLGGLPGLEPGETHFGELAPEFEPAIDGSIPVLARVRGLDGGSSLRIWTRQLGAWALDEQLLFELAAGQIRSPTFVSADRIAFLTKVPDQPDEIVLVDRRQPDLRWSIPVESIAADHTLDDLLPAATGLIVTVLDGDGNTGVLRVSVKDDGKTLPLPERTLAPDDLVVESLMAPRRVVGVALGPTGGLALVVVDPIGRDTEIALIDGETLTMVTDNELRDSLPRFTSDGRHLVFSSLMKVSISGRTFTVPRVVGVPVVGPD